MEKEKPVTKAKEGKYLTFALGHEEYGIEILRVREIIGLMEITAMPEVPAFVKGVINLRGKIIPVIDLRLKFGMEQSAYTKETCIIVLNVGERLTGIIVDRVCEVLVINSDQIEPVPEFGTRLRTDFITGMGKIGDRVKILINTDRVLNEEFVLSATAEPAKG